MNHYKARKRTDNERWDFTCFNHRTGTYPVGYCAGWQEWSLEDRQKTGMTDEWHMKVLSFRSRYHENGHASQEEAEQCYKRYLLDMHLELHKNFDTPLKCRVCGGWSSFGSQVGSWKVIALCDYHRTRQMVDRYFEVKESWES